MMFDIDLLRTIYRELRSAHDFQRCPEPDLVMETEESVEAFTRGGRETGALAGPYLYHIANMCQLVGSGDQVLDVGCGSGVLLSKMAMLNPRADFTGVDLSANMLAEAERIVRQKELSNVEFRLADMTALTMFEDHCFDVVVSSMALHHLPDVTALDATFREIARLLKPEGGLYINDLGQLRSLRSVEYFVERARVNESSYLADDYYHSLKAAFSLADFRTVLERYLPGRVKLYSTIVSPLVVVMTTGARYGIDVQLTEIKRLYSVLPPHRKADYRMLKLMLRAGGLPGAF